MSKNEIAILGLLAEGPKHGYQIHQDIKKREMDYWAKIKLASIYTTLTRLEEQGLIKSEKEKVGNMPERTVYALTSKGQTRLGDMVEKLLVEDERPEWLFGLGVAFIYGAAQERVLTALQLRQEKLQQCAVDLHEHLTTLKGQVPFNWYMLIENAHKHMQLERQWLDELIALVQSEQQWAMSCPFELAATCEQSAPQNGQMTSKLDGAETKKVLSNIK
ncbi:PadR family transcriptional regulator [candidate division KSB1 bacterium]|nr:PadR family transcriptional regulator [candidate division KSB1 bacterium]